MDQILYHTNYCTNNSSSNNSSQTKKKKKDPNYRTNVSPLGTSYYHYYKDTYKVLNFNKTYNVLPSEFEPSSQKTSTSATTPTAAAAAIPSPEQKVYINFAKQVEGEEQRQLRQQRRVKMEKQREDMLRMYVHFKESRTHGVPPSKEYVNGEVKMTTTSASALQEAGPCLPQLSSSPSSSLYAASKITSLSTLLFTPRLQASTKKTRTNESAAGIYSRSGRAYKESYDGENADLFFRLTR